MWSNRIVRDTVLTGRQGRIVNPARVRAAPASAQATTCTSRSPARGWCRSGSATPVSEQFQPFTPVLPRPLGDSHSFIGRDPSGIG